MPTKVSHSLAALYDTLGDKIKLIPNKDGKEIFDVYATFELAHNEKNERVRMLNINKEEKGLRLSVQVFKVPGLEEPGKANDWFIKLNREKKYYKWYNPEVEKQMIPETYHISGEMFRENEHFFVITDPYNRNLDNNYDEFCVDNLEEVLEIFRNMAEMVSSMHSKNIIHCNISLKRFLIKGDGLGYFITNFGLVDEKNFCKDHDAGFGISHEKAPEDYRSRLDLIKRQDVYALGHAFVELFNKNTLNTSAEPVLNASTLDDEKLARIFSDFGCTEVQHIEVGDLMENYLKLLHQVFKGQIKQLVEKMIVKDVNQIMDASAVYDKLVYLLSIYRKMMGHNVLEKCKSITAEKCLEIHLRESHASVGRKLI